MEDPKRLTYLFHRYYEKKCTDSERKELFELLQHAAHDEHLRKLIDDTWAMDFPAYHQSPQTADRILEYITRQQPPVKQPRRPFRVFLRYAAVLLAAALIAGIAHRVYHLHPSPSPPPVTAFSKPVTDSCITLSDGSKVLLHKNAHIIVGPSFEGPTREVALIGEAYFDIRSDKRPFIVHTGNIKTTVLGTAFNIDAEDVRDLVITVVKGKVKVENSTGDFSILRRNEQITVDVLHNKLKKVAVDAAAALVWKKPYLLFNDVSMKNAIEELQQKFHVEISLTNPASGSCHVTASFTQGEPLEQIIKVLSKINGMEYKLAGDGSFALTGEGCK